MLTEATFIRKPNIISKVNQDFSLLVVDMTTKPEVLYNLTGFSASVWSLINGTRNYSEIRKELELLYGNDFSETELLRDVKSLLAKKLIAIKDS